MEDIESRRKMEEERLKVEKERNDRGQARFEREEIRFVRHQETVARRLALDERRADIGIEEREHMASAFSALVKELE